VNVALTDSAEFTVTEQGLVPVQLAPLHPVKVLPVAGVAVSVTPVPAENTAEHVPPVDVQASMPAGLLATDPEPETVTVKTGGSTQVESGFREQFAVVVCGGGVGGVAHGLFTKSKNSSMSG
jgi:hypothetical protein